MVMMRGGVVGGGMGGEAGIEVAEGIGEEVGAGGDENYSKVKRGVVGLLVLFPSIVLLSSR
jgi:hypothetical protein